MDPGNRLVKVEVNVLHTTSCVADEKVVIITLTNNNAYKTLDFTSETATSTNGTVSVDSCSGATVAPAGTCAFTVTWTTAETPTTGNENTDIGLTESGAYFNDITIGSGDYDNSCN